MPPKPKYTREEIITAAIQIVREKGISAVTSRELGKQLGCSACPVFTVFSNMEEVHAGIVSYAKKLHKQYMDEGLQEEIAFRGAGKAYVRFAAEEPKLFHLLFLSEQKEITDLERTLPLLEENYEIIIEATMREYKIDEQMAKKLYKHLWIYTHGIATMCASKVCEYHAEDVQNLLNVMFRSLYTSFEREKQN